MTTHDLKTHPGPFAAALDGRKRFEWRKNDRNFAVGDLLHLREYDPETELGGIYTSRALVVRVTYMVAGPAFGVPDGWCVMSIAKVRTAAPEHRP